MSTYANPRQGVELNLKNKSLGGTYDPPEGSDWWECPFCENAGSYDGLCRHLLKAHNLRVVDSSISVRVNLMFDDDGLPVRYATALGQEASS
jgi:hypothetical protein